MKTIKLFSILSLLLMAEATSGIKRLSIPDTSGIKQGSIFLLPVRLDSTLAATDSVVAYQLQIQYSTYVLKLDSVLTQGTLSAGFGLFAFNEPIGGTVNITAAGSNALTGSGVLLYLRFKALQASYSNVSFTDTLHNFFNQNTSQPRVSLKNGSASVVALPSITISPSSGLLVVGEKLQFSPYGGKIPYYWSVTVDSVASIDSTGLLTAMHRGLTRVVVVDSAGVTDTTNGFVEVRSVKLSVPDTTTYVGQTISIPVRTSDLTGLGIVSGQLTFTFDGNIINPDSVVRTGSLLASYTGSVVLNRSVSGRADISFAGSIPLSGNGVLFYLRVKTSTNAGSTSLSFSGVLFNQDLLAKTTSGSVYSQSLVTLNLNRTYVNFIVGDTLRFATTNGKSPFYWSTTDTNIAKIDSLGLVTALRRGSFQAIVKDSLGSVGLSYVLNVYNAMVDIGDWSSPQGSIFAAPIKIRRMSGDTVVYSYQMVVQYDTTIMKAIAPVAGTLTGSWGTPTYNIYGNVVAVAGAGVTSFSGTGAIDSLRFQISPTATQGSSSALHFQQLFLNEWGPLGAQIFDGSLTVGPPTTPPPTPTLISPADSATGVATSLILRWSSAFTATSYHLQLASDVAFSTIVKDTTGITGTSAQVSLSTSTQYFWRVSGINVVGQGPYSAGRRFTTASVPTFVLGLQTPPSQFTVDQNFPNPFNPSTTIRYGLPSRSQVRISIYNTIGQVVVILTDGEQQAGYHQYVCNAGSMASGIYYYRVESFSLDHPTDHYTYIGKMILLK